MPMALNPRTRQRDGLKVSQAGFSSSSSSRFEKFLLRQVRVLSLSSFVELTCQARIISGRTTIPIRNVVAVPGQHSILPCHQGRCGLNALEPL